MTRIRFALPIVVAALLTLPGKLSANTTYLQTAGDNQLTPGHAIVLQFQTNAKRGDAVTAAVYRISQARYLASANEPLTEREVADLPEVSGARSAEPPKDDQWQRQVDLAPLEIGTYAVVARVADATSVSALNVTTIGLTIANSNDGNVYMPTDLRTFSDVPAASLSVRSENGSATLPLFGGIARIPNSSASVVVRAADGSVAFATQGRCCDADLRDVGIVQTDRSVYRPGDTIRLRAIVRRGNVEDYGIPSGTLHLQLASPDGVSIADRDLAVSAYGTVSASVRLPEDARLGTYLARIGTLEHPILVAAYKKPEYEIGFADTPLHAVGGNALPVTVSARYFFGRPAGGMHVHYVAYSQPFWYWRWWGPYASFVETAGLWNRNERKELAAGDAVTDANGRATFPVATKPVRWDSDVTIEASARDASGRTVTLSTSVLLTAAAFRLSAAPDTWFATPGQPTTIRLRAGSYDGDKPIAHLPITIAVNQSHWDGRKEVQDGTASLQATTGADGSAAIVWTPQQSGNYRFDVSATDDTGRVARSQTYLWATGNSWLAPIERPMLVEEKSAVRPDRPAYLLLAIPHAGRDVLLVTTSDRLCDARVVHVTGTSLRVSVAVPHNASSFDVFAMMPTENGVEQANARIDVAQPERALHVTVVSRKKRYEPGETARFDLLAVGSDGRPKQAEFGIGVVDQAIYAVQADDGDDPLRALYGTDTYVQAYGTWFRPNFARPEAVKTIATTRSQASGMVRSGVASDIYSVSGVSLATPVRANFLDTAYWSPSVVTDREGRATISFPWPDNLTSWTATGVGVTASGDVGRGQGNALVTKDFLVRLETPRFLRAGDQSSIVGIAQGQANAPDVRLDLDPGALSTLSSLDPPLRLDANQSASSSWPVAALNVGSTALTLYGSDGVRRDAMRAPLPLLAATAAEYVRDAGESARRPTLTISIPRGYTPGAVHLSISPSLLAELVQNQRLLDVYPYYCTEQTMSAALPALFIGRVARAAHLRLPDDVDFHAILRHAIARLRQLQHEDGSWGWWESDDGHPFMTAYALYGLAEFRKEGVKVPDDMFDRGVESLVSQMQLQNRDTLAFWGGGQPGSEWNTRAFMLFALANAAPDRVDRNLLAEAAAHAGRLNPYALSVLGLTEHRLGDDATARQLLQMLDGRAIADGPFLRWQGATWHYAWEDDPIETTAYALRFEVAMQADPNRTDRIVNFLRSERRGDWWYTTKDTAAAIYALSEAVPSAFSPNETERVTLDGRVIRSLRVSSPVLDAADSSIVIPASQIRDGSVIGFETTGKGALFWSSDAIRYVPENAVKAVDPGTPLFARLFAVPPPLSVSRHYSVTHPGAWRVGDEVVVDLVVRAASASQYVAVEDPLPAGAEHVTEQGKAAEDSWSGLQFFDDRTVFFADRLSPDSPLKIRYTLRVTTPGRYAAPAPSAYAMYGPPVTALGRQQTVAVVP